MIDDIELLLAEAKKIGDQVKADYILEEWQKSDKSYDELMEFLKGDSL